MSNEIIKINRDELKGSYLDALRSLGNTLGISSDSESKENILDKIVEKLREKDQLLIGNKMTEEDKKKILQSIWEYKVICNNNDAEDRMANTLNLFIKDIYKDSLHFFLELIQNADDASKNLSESKDEHAHSLTITIEQNGEKEFDKDIVFEYDERGFNFSDLFAITSLGNSTKKAQLNDNADIGEKGIGFKSIFAIVEEISIQSKYFSFKIRLQDNKMISILEPTEITLNTGENTKLRLKIKENIKTKTFYDNIDTWMTKNILCKELANPFLFLKNIRTVNYIKKTKSGSSKETIKIQKTHIENTKFTSVSINDNKYIIYTSPMKFDKQAIISRWKHLESEVGQESENFTIERPAQICFPLLKNNADRLKGKIYSYLPTTLTLNLPIFINLDVHLTASRGNITQEDFAQDSKWNKQVKENLVDFMIESYDAIVESANQDDLKNHAELTQLRESLYHFIPTNQFEGCYSEELAKFSEEIKTHAIFMSNDGKFELLKNIRYVSSMLGDKANDQTLIEAIYAFNGGNRLTELYPKNVAWNKLIYKLISYTHPIYDAFDFVKAQKGFKHYLVLKDGNERTVLEHMVQMLRRGITKREGYKELEIIPIENDVVSTPFDLKSYNEIDAMKKAVFLHCEDQTLEDKTNSVYIYEGEEAIAGLKELVANTYSIGKYDLNDYFRRVLKELQIDTSHEIDEQTISELIDKTFRFYCHQQDCFSTEVYQETKSFMCHYTLSSEDIKYLDEMHQDEIHTQYIAQINGLNQLKPWSIPDETQRGLYIKFLMALGIKYKVEFMNGDIDPITKEIINSNSWESVEIDERTRVVKVSHSLQKYLLDQINKHTENISKENLKVLCIQLGLFNEAPSKYTLNNKEIFILDEQYITKINNEIDKIKAKEVYTLNDSDFCVISKSNYSNIWDKLKKMQEASGILTTDDWEDIKYNEDNSVQRIFINSFPGGDERFIKTLRMLKITNQVFKVEYAWHNEIKELNLQQFLSCYEALINEGLGTLIKKGYCVNNLKNLKHVQDECNSDLSDLEDFLQSIKNPNDSPLVGKGEIDFSEFGILNEQDSKDVKDDFIRFDMLANKTNGIRYILKKQEKKSDLIINLLKAKKDITIYDYQKKEIRDYFNENPNKDPRTSELNCVGFPKYTKDIFLSYHKENVAKGIEELPSIWEKRILNKLCMPFTLTDNHQMAGYEYTCPICGQKSFSALSGMKFSRFRQEKYSKYPYIYVVSCLNCHAHLKYAKSVEILDFENIMDKFKNCYCADDAHMTNQAAMMTVMLQIKSYDNHIRTMPMKISYLNMVLYEKLAVN